jgi:hypothetical protein
MHYIPPLIHCILFHRFFFNKKKKQNNHFFSFYQRRKNQSHRQIHSALKGTRKKVKLNSILMEAAFERQLFSMPNMLHNSQEYLSSIRIFRVDTADTEKTLPQLSSERTGRMRT